MLLLLLLLFPQLLLFCSFCGESVATVFRLQIDSLQRNYVIVVIILLS